MFILIATHLGSGASMLCDSLARHPLVSRGVSRGAYRHPHDLSLMKTDRYARIHFDKVVFNYQVGSSSLYRSCRYIFVVRGPDETLASIISRGYQPDRAVVYYRYRLRRLCEMAKHVDGMLVTWDDLVTGRAFESVQKFLGLKRPLVSTYVPEGVDKFVDNSARQCYERYFRYLASKYNYDVFGNINSG